MQIFPIEQQISGLFFLLYAHLIYGIAAANQIWLAVSLRLPRRGQWKVRDEPVRHFLNDLVVGRAGLNGACVIALRSNTARNVREGRIIKTSTTDRLLVLSFFFFFVKTGTWITPVWLLHTSIKCFCTMKRSPRVTNITPHYTKVLHHSSPKLHFYMLIQ